MIRVTHDLACSTREYTIEKELQHTTRYLLTFEFKQFKLLNLTSYGKITQSQSIPTIRTLHATLSSSYHKLQRYSTYLLVKKGQSIVLYLYVLTIPRCEVPFFRYFGCFEEFDDYPPYDEFSDESTVFSLESAAKLVIEVKY